MRDLEVELHAPLLHAAQLECVLGDRDHLREVRDQLGQVLEVVLLDALHLHHQLGHSWLWGRVGRALEDVPLAVGLQLCLVAGQEAPIVCRAQALHDVLSDMEAEEGDIVCQDVKDGIHVLGLSYLPQLVLEEGRVVLRGLEGPQVPQHPGQVSDRDLARDQRLADGCVEAGEPAADELPLMEEPALEDHELRLGQPRRLQVRESAQGLDGLGTAVVQEGGEAALATATAEGLTGSFHGGAAGTRGGGGGGGGRGGVDGGVAGVLVGEGSRVDERLVEGFGADFADVVLWFLTASPFWSS